jgi:hypothetical protein
MVSFTATRNKNFEEEEEEELGDRDGSGIWTPWLANLETYFSSRIF